MNRVFRGRLSSSLGASGCLASVAFCIFCWAMMALLFQYNIRCTFGRDLPWYLDAVGGLVCNGVNLIWATVCFFAQVFGAKVPFFGE